MKKGMKRILVLVMVALLSICVAACGNNPPMTPPTPPDNEGTEGDVTAQPVESTPAEPSTEVPFIPIVSKGQQHQFWQVVKKGAEQAAADFNVRITFEGPASESDIGPQVDMLKAALAQKPAAICLAALSTDAVMEQLQECKNNGIPVIGFDSGVPDAPAGTIYATASTNNQNAAALAADNLYANEDFAAKVAAATAAAPVYVGVLSQDATSESITGRTIGFIDRLTELIGADKVDVSGHAKYAQANDNASVKIVVNIPATTDAADLKSGAEALLMSANTISAIYGSNEGAANGILAATNDGADFAGKYSDILAIGFDAGKGQKDAVTKGWFYGSITQDPYQIGYKAVALAVDAINGVAAASPIVDTGAQWYNKDNITDPMINDLVYE